MSGIDGSRTLAAAAVLGRIGAAPVPARHHSGPKAVPYADDAERATEPTRAGTLRGTARPAYAVGFLAQTIAQESLLLDARESRSDQRQPTDLYRRTQGERAPLPGPQIGIDLKI